MLKDAKNLLRTFAADESGTTAIEYGLIAAGIAAVIIVTVSVIGDTMQTQYYSKIHDAFDVVSK
jgi:pilus assembly protein Flp/PilA